MDKKGISIVIVRFSAIGDVAMTVPVVDSLARQWPEARITMVSQAFLQPLFERCPANVRFVGVRLKAEHKGLRGIYHLFRQLCASDRYDAMADLHDVLRTKVLRILFRLCGVRVRHIDKGRYEKRLLTRGKSLSQLKTSVERYAEVLHNLGMSVTVDFSSIYADEPPVLTAVNSFAGAKKGRWIGIAPFAKHAGKIYPLERSEAVVKMLSSLSDVTLFLFGGGETERAMLESWSSRYPHTVSVAGKLAMNEELALISRLDVMFSMDSANMHLASLTATPVVSVWGATHPFAGFYGYHQAPENAIQVDLPCRPCSVYGNKPCRRGDYACLTGITEERIVKTIEKVVNAR